MKTAFRASAVLAALSFPAPVGAADRAAPLFGANAYWSGFVDYWQGVFQQQNGIGMGICAVGAVALFIITRGKWLK